MTSRLWKWSALRDASAKALLMSVACSTFLVRGAICQTVPARAVKGIAAVDSLVAAEFAKDSIGSITVGVIAGSQLAWTRSFGFADMKARRMANRNTVYRIGSITKPFTAVMLMQLVTAGRVQLSDPVERYLPEVKQIASKPQGALPFTFLQLATMTAGLAREPDDAGPFWTGPVSAWEKTLLAALPHTSYTSFPGTEFSYSNIGYAILGAALARVADQPYVEWERLQVFRPLGMERTRFEIDPTIKADLAVGYQVNGDGTLDDHTAAQEARDGRGYKVPNGAIFTTVDDLARFVVFELGRGPDSVLARPVLDAAFGGIVATDAFLETGYGLGFMAMRRDGYSFLGHSGSVAGYRAAMYYDRGMQLGVVVFRNVVGGKQDPDRLAVDILSSLAATKRAEIQADIDRRVKAQVAAPGSEAAVRRLIGELRLGKPNYDLMGSALARLTRRQITQEQATIAKLGALQSLSFTGVGPAGPDIYQAAFEKGSLEWRIWLNMDGSVDYFTYRAVAERLRLPDTGVARSADGHVAFVRATPGRLVSTSLGDEEATELWIADSNGANPRRLVTGTHGDSVERTLAAFSSPRFSPDGRRVYFLSRAWVTSDAVHAVDVSTGRERFVAPGNSIEVIPRGPFAGCLIVQQHRHRPNVGGSFDWTWILDTSGREIALAATDSAGADQRLAVWMNGGVPTDALEPWRAAPSNARCS